MNKNNSKQFKNSKQSGNSSKRYHGKGTMKSSRIGKEDEKHSLKPSEMQDYAKKNAVSNDPAWYASDPTLARDSASIPFSWATGTATDMNSNLARTFNSVAAAKIVMPGIMVFNLQPTIGTASSPSDPVNVAATALYSFIRHQNSGSANYDAPDLMLYILAIGDFIAMYNHCVRLYGIASLYSSRNRYLPDALINALGVNAENLRSNLASFRYYLNVIANKASSLAVPSTLSYFKRKAFLYSGLYTEGSSAKDQMYAYCPQGYYVYEHDADGAGMLTVHAYGGLDGTPLTVNDLIVILSSMLDPLIRSEDINIMSGDIIKAYGENGILKYGRVDEGYFVVPTFDIGVLEQMKNATVFRVDHNTLAVKQSTDKGYLVSTPGVNTVASPTVELSAYYRFADENRILVTTTEFVDPSLVLENTRLMTAIHYDPAAKFVHVTGCTEICSNVVISRFSVTSKGEIGPVSKTMFETYNVMTKDSISDLSGAILGHAQLDSFDFRPLMAYAGLNTAGSTPSISFISRTFDYDNYAILTPQDVTRMHEACLLNMLHVPSIGSIF